MWIKQLSVKNIYGVIQVLGVWLIQGNVESICIEGKVNSWDVGVFLFLMGVNFGIKDLVVDVIFILDWQDLLFNFLMVLLNGNIEIQLIDGYFMQVSDKGLWIFILFSLNLLVCKLSLDFWDVFVKGFFYDDIQGSF